MATSARYVMYTLISDDGHKSYVGITTDFAHRLRQHNGELKGGARRTRAGNCKWRPAFVLSGFDSDRTARQFEWRMHRKWHRGGKLALHRRVAQLLDMLNMPQATSSCTETNKLSLQLTWHVPNPRIEAFHWPSCIKQHVFV